MQTFRYKGLTARGAEVSGVIKAYNESEAVTKLREELSVITDVEEVKEQTGLNRDVGSKKIKDKDLSIICSQFSIILRSGLPLVKCVELVAAQMKNKGLTAAMQHVGEDLAAGYSLAQGFENCGWEFPTTFIETIRAGETSGTLEHCFDRLQVYYEKASKTRGKVVSALTYPAIVIVVAVVVFIIIMVVAVPLFTSTFEELGMELPGITRALIAVSKFMTHWWWFLALLGALLYGCYILAMRSEAGKRAISQFRLSRSPLHKITAMSSAASFASTLSTMIGAGLPIVKALDVTSAVVTNYTFSLAVRKVKEGVERGRGISDCMREVEYFPKMLTEMVGVGEKSGSLQDTLDVVSEYFDNEVDLATQRLLSIMEPAITVGLAGVTVVLLLAVYLPMFNMYGSV